MTSLRSDTRNDDRFGSVGRSRTLRVTAVDRMAAQWIAVGGQLSGKREETVIDLEALVAVTSSLGEADPRVRGVAIDWIVGYGKALNISRLKTVSAEIDVPLAALESFGAAVASAGGPRWPFAGNDAGVNRPRKKVVVHDLTDPSRLVWRIRSAFGVNARADILAALLTMPASPVTVADLARRTRFSKRNVALAVDSMRLAGVLATVRVGNEVRVKLDTSSPLRDWLEPADAPDIDWVSRWKVVLRLLQATESVQGAQGAARIVESRVIARALLPSLGPAGLPLPDLSATGSDFERAFDEWVSSVEVVLDMFGA